MPDLPDYSFSILVRTDFDAAHGPQWPVLLTTLETQTEDGFWADVAPIDDPAWANASADALRNAALAAGGSASAVFAADQVTLTHPELPVLVIAVHEGGAPFRCVASQLYEVDANLNAGRISAWEFREHLSGNGLYRGLRP